MPKKPAQPVTLHPGAFVRAEIIAPLGLSVSNAAAALGVHRVALSRFLNEQAALSADMAIRLEKAFGAKMEELMQMQANFDIARARMRFREIKMARYVPAKTIRKNQLQLF